MTPGGAAAGSAAAAALPWRPESVPRQTLRLMAARWRVVYNSVLRGARWRQATYLAVGAALVFLGFVALVIAYFLTVGITELTAPEVGRADVIVAIALTGTLTLSVLVSFTVALGALYLSTDLDLLLAAPVARRAVFAAKLIGGLLPANLVLLVMAAVPLLGHGLALDYGGGYYLAVVVSLLLLPVLPAAVGALAVMVIVRRVSAHRLGNVVGLVIIAMTLSIAFVAGGARQLQEALVLADILAVFERVRTPYSPAEWLTRAVTAAGRDGFVPSLPWFALAGSWSLLGLVLLGVFSDRLYYAGWTHMQSADRRRELRESRMPWNRVDRAAALARPSGLLARLSAPTVALMRKDLRIVPRDLTNMAQVLSPLAVGVFFVLQRLLYPIRLGPLRITSGLIDPLLAMLSAGVATGVSAMILSRFCLTAFSIEGRAYWLVKSAPVSRRELLVAKFLVAFGPYSLLGGVLVVLLEVARAISDARAAGELGLAAAAGAFNPFLVLYAWFVVVVVGIGVLAINLVIGVARPNLQWDTPHEMLTPDVGCLSLVLYGAYGFVAGMALILPVAVSGFPVITNPVLLWLGGLGVGLGVTALVAVTAYLLAVHEVDAVGE